MRDGGPHLSLTRTDHVAIFILYRNSDKLRHSLIGHLPRGTWPYDMLVREFEALWQANEA
jgi:hypothetical protein